MTQPADSNNMNEFDQVIETGTARSKRRILIGGLVSLVGLAALVTTARIGDVPTQRRLLREQEKQRPQYPHRPTGSKPNYESRPWEVQPTTIAHTTTETMVLPPDEPDVSQSDVDHFTGSHHGTKKPHGPKPTRPGTLAKSLTDTLAATKTRKPHGPKPRRPGILGKSSTKKKPVGPLSTTTTTTTTTTKPNVVEQTRSETEPTTTATTATTAVDNDKETTSTEKPTTRPKRPFGPVQKQQQHHHHNTGPKQTGGSKKTNLKQVATSISSKRPKPILNSGKIGGGGGGTKKTLETWEEELEDENHGERTAKKSNHKAGAKK